MKQLFTLLFIGLTSLYSQTIPSYVPTNGLVGWWPFNGNANDESGNGNNGTVYGATLSNDRFGKPHNAYIFDGVDDYISGNSSNLNVQSTNELTIASWVNVIQFASPPAASKIITHTNASNIGQQYALSIGNNGSLYFLAGNGAFENNGPNTSPSGLIQSNTWAHLTAVIAVDSVKLYLNGYLVMSKPEVDLFPSNPVGTFVFSSPTNSTFNKLFNGLIDDVGIWNRALTQQEILALYYGCNDSLQLQPQNFTAYSITGWANFKCESSDTAATYQWQQNSGAGWTNLTNLGNYSGTTSDSLVIIGVTSAMNNYGYRCIVTGCTTDTSDVAVLNVVNGIGLGESSLQKLTVSPIPTNGIVSLNTSVVGTYELLTLDGRVLETGTAKKDYDLTKYPKGVYHLRLSTDEGIRVLKVVKN